MHSFDIYGNKSVLIVDDNYDHASGIRELVRLESRFDVKGIAASASIGISLIKKHKPDIVLMDINMPDMDGITAIQEIQKTEPDVKIIALTGYDDADLIFRAMKVGTRGYLLKTMAASQLTRAMEEVLNGKIYLPAALAVKFFDHFQDSFKEDNITKISDGENLLSYLTQREEEVLSLLTNGTTYKGVAKQLFISETTVKTHVNNIFQKLQVNDRTQAVLYALNHGLDSRNKMKTAV
ncbi:MAG TPA: response regulator transcription factor [Candidatus Gastranaerophilales bacterium]|nr:response regulator transcription factor [Candidatus Gastranaerophilales bacterium]